MESNSRGVHRDQDWSFDARVRRLQSVVMIVERQHPAAIDTGQKVRASQSCDVGGRRSTSDVLGGADLGQTPILDNRDPIGQQEGIGWVMGDKQPRTSKGGQVLGQHPAKRSPGRDIERSQGFIKKKQIGFGCKSSSEGNSLGLTTGEVEWLPVAKCTNAQPLKQVLRQLASLRFGLTQRYRTKHHVLEHR